MLYAKFLEMVTIFVNKQNFCHSEKRTIWMNNLIISNLIIQRNEKNDIFFKLTNKTKLNDFKLLIDLNE